MVLKGTMRSAGLAAVVVLVAIVLPVGATMPDYTGISYPNTFWAKMGNTNTVMGKVVASSGASHGIGGAYVAIVNASNVSEEYANTTSGADGSYSFSNVNATYFQKSDRYDPMYKLYAYEEGYGEAYSTAFGVDVAAISAPMEVWVVIPVNATKAPGSSIVAATPAATVVPSLSSAPVRGTPASTSQDWTWESIAIIAAVIAIVLAGAGAYLYIRKRL